MKHNARRKYLWKKMRLLSRLRWLVWRFAKRAQLPGVRESLRVRLAEGPILNVRYGTLDRIVAHEVFLNDDYRRPWLPTPEGGWVVDLGGNVGYSTLDFANRWPNCRVLTVEPIPEHVAAIRGHVALNGLVDRVEVLEAAAGIENGELSMIAEGICSRAGQGDAGEIRVRKVDILAELQQRQPISLLKVDIEGAEFDILADDRLRELAIDSLIVEWHDYDIVDDPQATARRLVEQAGFEVVEEADNSPHGMIYASRSSAAQRRAA